MNKIRFAVFFIYEAAYVLLLCLQEGVWADMRSVIHVDEDSVSVTECHTDLTGFDWLMDGRFLGRLALREKDDEFEYYNITRACLLE